MQKSSVPHLNKLHVLFPTGIRSLALVSMVWGLLEPQEGSGLLEPGKTMSSRSTLNYSASATSYQADAPAPAQPATRTRQAADTARPAPLVIAVLVSRATVAWADRRTRVLVISISTDARSNTAGNCVACDAPGASPATAPVITAALLGA